MGFRSQALHIINFKDFHLGCGMDYKTLYLELVIFLIKQKVHISVDRKRSLLFVFFYYYLPFLVLVLFPLVFSQRFNNEKNYCNFLKRQWNILGRDILPRKL